MEAHMRVTRRSLGWLSAVGLCLAAGAVAYGCGSDSSGGDQTPPGTTDDGGGDVSIEGAAGGGDATPISEDCTLNGNSCNANADCCTGNCDQNTKTCANPPGTCKQPGEACVGGPECCSVVCANGVCGSGVCVSDHGACTTGAECCSGKCGQVPEGGSSNCIPLNSGCKTAGNECGANAECCSKFCVNGRCSGQPSFCTQLGDACINDFECCTGICNKQASDPAGICAEPIAPGATGCLAAGSVCGAGAEGDAGTNDAGVPLCGGACCSRSCFPYGPTGVLVCQPPSGCRPTGEICQQDSDCCGAPGSLDGDESNVHCSKDPNQPVGRCDNGNKCRAAGAICKPANGSCNAENNCCAGNVNTDPSVCQQDLLGIPRCTGAGPCDDAGSKAGQPCASSADCCGLSCVPNKNAGDAGPPFICGDGTCVPAGGECTTTADCCAPLPCVAPPGSTKGICGYVPPDAGVPEAGQDAQIPDVQVPDSGPTCADYGQTCAEDADCCNNVPCTQGRCLYPIY